VTSRTAGPNAAADSPTGYGPSDLQLAYGLTSAASASGSGRTIDIVDAYDDPNAESDLASTHDSQALMPEQPSDTPSLRFVSDEQQVEFR
jgi:subtilase family serine protease